MEVVVIAGFGTGGLLVGSAAAALAEAAFGATEERVAPSGCVPSGRAAGAEQAGKSISQQVSVGV